MPVLSIFILLCSLFILRGTCFVPPQSPLIPTKSYHSGTSTRSCKGTRPHYALPVLNFDSIVGSSTNLDTVKSLLLDSTTGDLDFTKVGLATLLPLFLLSVATRPPARLVSTSSLQAILEGTFLERTPIQNLKCVYKASRDGWSAVNFHDAVDGKGSAVMVGRTLTGTDFGAYNPVGWRSTDDYFKSSAAFLFSFGGMSKNRVIKYPVLPGGEAAIFDYATAGPCFGSSDLLIGPPRAAVMGLFAGPDMEDTSANAGNLRQGKSSIGWTYDCSDTRWPVRGAFQLSELEIYCNEKL